MDDPVPDLSTLVRATRGGDQDAARALLEALHPLVVRLVRCHRPRRTDEEDLVQQVFLRVFSRLEQYSGTVPIEHWVSRVTVNTCLNQLKHERVRPELRWSDLTEPEEKVIHELTADPAGVLPGQELAARDLLDRLLDRLPAKDRVLLTLLHLEERTVAEVASALGWNTTLVKVRAFRARRRLRGLLDTVMKDEPKRVP